ncbi:M23 family metallopeptidase [Nonomuraea rosea]|uniref:M23 family metallopeptidase n=1 Tax=Nonomuraea rosea TaxID=638574 RepID=UPI003CD0825A
MHSPTTPKPTGLLPPSRHTPARTTRSPHHQLSAAATKATAAISPESAHPTPRSIPPPPPAPSKAVTTTVTTITILLTPILTLTASAFAVLILAIPTPSARASPATWRWPLEGQPRILRRFTPPPEPWLAGHRGIDLAAPTATTVVSAGQGTVHFAGPVAGKGVVTIDHPDGLRTTYLPVAASVRRGQPVAQGAKLGVIEASAEHCQESCLHWGLLRDTLYLDPLLLLARARIRLLPFWPTSTTNTSDALTTRARSPLTTADAKSPALPQTALPGTPSPRLPALPRTRSIGLPPHQPLEPTPPEPPSQAAATNAPFLTRSASTPTAPALGLGTLLGTTLLILVLARRRRRRTRTSQAPPRTGQHRKQSRRRTRKRRPTSSPPPW